ncbi:PAS domain-containing protein [Methylobacterium sp. J-072]|uniref:PAS domain-containing protein n=1 Tax=Methylobacterium sp. J-072 TaxID=2836651 RepID=UPI001FBB6F6F|nr:PAS domain-containing protein [Methylobacterium sp. J-072]MCJ2096951.1 PAS domain-containing protein [Methylobacterium sp. J-072]
MGSRSRALQTTQTSTTGAAEADLAAAFAAWARLPSLAAALTDPDALYLVIDPADGRVLLASPSGQALAAAADTASLGRQIARAHPHDTAPRLARLSLDARRIAPPALCQVVSGTRDDGRPAVLVIPTAPVKLPRPRSAAPAAPQVEAPARESTPAAIPVALSGLNTGDRFLWRSDASGALTTLTGSEGLAGLVGQRWQDLAETGRITGADGMFAALRDRSTFRAEPARLDLGDGPFQVELSGAPLGRGDAAFSGFGGFGLVRSVPAPPVPTEAPTPIEPVAAPEESPELVPSREPVQAPVASAVLAPGPTERAPARVEQAAAAGPMSAETPASTAPTPAEPQPAIAFVEHPPHEPAEPTDAPAPPTPMPAAPEPPAARPVEQPSLSTDEHAAFREIARALGARYAGDDAAAPIPAPRGGAVMPFPGPHAGVAEAREAAATRDLDFLAGLPLPTLVHREGVILAANQALLEITGYADVPALTKAGLDQLFRGLPQSDGPDPAARRTAVAAADGSARAVEVMGGPCTWEGRPATCLVLRPIDEADPAGALTAERLARAAQAERTAAAEAALDALEAGVLTLDGAGRIVAMNRAAAELFGCDPREIVGGSFVALFDRESVLAVADALRGAAGAPRPVSVAGRALTIGVSPAREDGRRVAVLNAAPVEILPSAEPPPAPASGLDGALARLDRAFRGPLNGMVELADAMLKEPFGPLGDVRYRGCLAQIKTSGALMLERVGELLDLATVEAGALRLDPRRIALNDVVAGCVAQLQGEAARGRIVVRTSFSTGLDDLEADERSVSRAACLVIEHAIRRSAAGGQVIVSTGSTESAAVALRVRDTGAGATQAASGPAGEVEDGLALPRALVEANGGRLQLSARPEDGTLVEIIMPTRRAANG